MFKHEHGFMLRFVIVIGDFQQRSPEFFFRPGKSLNALYSTGVDVEATAFMEKTAGDDRAGRSSADREEKNPVVTFR
jgi:hypothetical protein